MGIRIFVIEILFNFVKSWFNNGFELFWFQSSLSIPLRFARNWPEYSRIDLEQNEMPRPESFWLKKIKISQLDMLYILYIIYDALQIIYLSFIFDILYIKFSLFNIVL